jgi:5,10-methylenetetrahydromethanopterin reductase
MSLKGEKPMTVQFATIPVVHHSAELPRLVQQIETWGFEALGVPDAHWLWPDCYVTLTQCALNSRRLRLGTFVTNPLTRHPAVTAGAIAAINELSEGRAFLGIGTGDSAVYNVGFKAATVAQFREALVAIKGFYTGETHYLGKPVRQVWVKRPVPLYVCAEGPKTLRLAGELADGVIVGSGLTPEVVRDAYTRIREGAEAAGRRLEDLDIWFFAKTNVAENAGTAVDEIRMALAASANHAFRRTLEGKHIPPPLHEPIEKLKAAYRPHEHELLGAERVHARLVDELGLKGYLAERFAIVGTVQNCITQIERAAAAGVQKIFLGPITGEPARVLQTFAQEILPRFR